jgi:adenine-specific DNA-methyltransferase
MPFLQFKGKSAIESYHHVVAHHRLEFDGKLSVLAKGEKPGLGGNLIIEGDNLLALKALLPTHAGRIKCVYIDPPYNTGNEGWVYNDNLTQPQFKEWIGRTVGKEGEDACRHDKWCCMMYPRLELLKDLLRDDGAIFISIDDNEVQHLRMIMDEVFGEENFVATIVWQKRTSPDARLMISDAHEYVMLYAKEVARLRLAKVPKSPKDIAQYKNPDNDPRGPWVSSDYTAQGYRPNQMYKIRTPGGAVYEPPPGVCWKNVEAVFMQLAQDGRIWFGRDGNSMPRRKTFLSESEGNTPWTWWDNEECGHSQEAKKEIAEMFGDGETFSTPKPVRLIERILRLATGSDDLVLDSFAGSGTTAHAVLSLNAEDRGSRRFILVQQAHDTNEDKANRRNLAREVTAERVRRVALGYTQTDEIKTVVPGLGGAFTYARVGDRLFGEYRDLGKKLPSFEELAKYIFYTETSRECDLKVVDAESGFIGATDVSGGTSYYLLYTPNHKADCELSLETLKALAKKDKTRNWVVYCEKVWLHQDQLRKFEQEHGKHVRPMLVPFNLK